jgi:hypothetical protein
MTGKDEKNYEFDEEKLQVKEKLSKKGNTFWLCSEGGKITFGIWKRKRRQGYGMPHLPDQI